MELVLVYVIVDASLKKIGLYLQIKIKQYFKFTSVIQRLACSTFTQVTSQESISDARFWKAIVTVINKFH